MLHLRARLVGFDVLGQEHVLVLGQSMLLQCLGKKKLLIFDVEVR